MSKVAGAIEGTDRAALEAFVQSGDTSVPGVEMSDLNDGDILARTRENVNPNGLFQFVYIPDDGSENITSDWVDQEHKKKLVRQWVDGVKGNIIARANATINAAKEKAIEDRARAIRDEQFADEQPVGRGIGESTKTRHTPAAVHSPTQHDEVVPLRSPVQPSADPTDYVGDQLELARERLRGAEMAQQDIVREVLSARRDYEKWKTLAAALGSVSNDSLPRTLPEAVADASRSSDRSGIMLGTGGGNHSYTGRRTAPDRAPGSEGHVGISQKPR